MVSLLYVCLLIAICFSMFFCITIISELNVYSNIKNKIIGKNKVYINLNKKSWIKKKINIFDKLNFLLIKTGIKENRALWWITPQTIIAICILLFAISFIIFKPILKLGVLAFLFCVPIGLIPIFLLMIISDIYEENIEKNLINYIIQLKNQAQISNDVIFCFKNTVNYVKKPLSIYIKKFLFQIDQGINLSTAFEELKTKVQLDRFKQFIANTESCCINGGNFYNLLEKTQNVLLKIQNERNKRNEETMSARIVLGILICISLFIYFKFVNFNQENFEMMINDFFGQLILVFNFISIWLMLFLIIYVKKFDK